MMFGLLLLSFMIVGGMCVEDDDNCSCTCTNKINMSRLKPYKTEQDLYWNNDLIARFIAMQDVPDEFRHGYVFIESDYHEETSVPEKDLFSYQYGVARFGDYGFPQTDILYVSDDEVDSDIVLVNVPSFEELPPEMQALYDQESDEPIWPQLFSFKGHWFGVYSVMKNAKKFDNKFLSVFFCRDPGAFPSFLLNTTRLDLGFDSRDEGWSASETSITATTRFYGIPKARFYASETCGNKAVRNVNLLGNDLVQSKLDWVEIYYGKDRGKVVERKTFEAQENLVEQLQTDKDMLDEKVKSQDEDIKSKDEELALLRQQIEELQMKKEI